MATSVGRSGAAGATAVVVEVVGSGMAGLLIARPKPALALSRAIGR
jgi:hypothetical protein